MTTMHTVALDRALIHERIAHARRTNDEVFEHALDPRAILERPIPERHRMLFYLGHVEAFDLNIIVKHGFKRDTFKPEFDDLFAFGIDPIGGGLPNEPASDWPALSDVMAYRERARDMVDTLVDTIEVDDPQYAADVFNTAIEHRLEHAETLAYLLQQLPTHLKRTQPQANVPAPVVRHGMVEIPAGKATLGRVRGHGFGWCNEFDEHVVEVPAFSVDRYPVTNGRFMEFVKAGGYAERRHWSGDDWAWRESRELLHPTFWIRRSSGWNLRGMFSEFALPMDWPVYVSLAEARAFARWAGKRLMTEPEFHRAAYGTPEGREREYPWGDDAPAARHGNFDFHRWDPAPVGAYPEGVSAFGVSELVGNGYEWTSTPFAPFDGFEAYPFYPGYSANFFDGRHFVIKGGSARTAAPMLRRSFRNWFQAHYPYMFAKFRLVSR